MIKTETTEFFDVIWNKYPKRHGKRLLKADALKEFKKFRRSDWEPLEKAVINFSKSQSVREGIGIRDFVRFLKKEYWR